MNRIRCRWCQKLVADKPILGTLHVCLTPEQRRLVDIERQQAEWQMRQQMALPEQREPAHR